MNRNLRAVILILTNGLLALNQAAAAKTRTTDAILTIGIRNYANVDAETLKNAETVATLIFRKAGVQTQWIDLKIPTDFLSSVLQVQLIAGAMVERLNFPRDVMGVAPGNDRDRRFVYVFYDGVGALAQSQKQARIAGKMQQTADRAQILGTLIAHEIGHLLLNLTSHSAAGIMRGGWNLKDLEDVALGYLVFTRSQAETIQAEVVRRAGRRDVMEVANKE